MIWIKNLALGPFKAKEIGSASEQYFSHYFLSIEKFQKKLELSKSQNTIVFQEKLETV